jgi:hypothetical protein
MKKEVAMKFQEFTETSSETLITNLIAFHTDCMNEKPSNEQIKVWRNSITILKDILIKFIQSDQALKDCFIILEFELPRERGRRPDVLLLFNSSIIVIEFKERPIIERAYVDQVAAYARDINNYHEYSHTLNVIPLLLMVNQKNLKEHSDEVLVLSKDLLFQYLCEFWKDEKTKEALIDYRKWVDGDYLPLPSLIHAARLIFNHEPLPTIRRAQSAGIPTTLKKINSIAINAKQNKEHHLALITGVPGAGKTLVGISFVYEFFTANDTSPQAVLLSGNGPLVEVLQYALKSSVFVQDVHGFLKTYGGTKQKIPREFIFIYDEAQRAWDKDQVKEKRGHDKSEPEDFLTIGSKKDWCLMVGLIGEGQEIHLGEESGIEQWNDAIKTSNNSWQVSCPSKLKSFFTNGSSIEIAEELNLSQSLRSHIAIDVQHWINFSLEADIENAKNSLEKIYKEQFDVYITRDLEKAKNYVRTRYSGEKEKRYGLLASSKDKILPRFGVMNDFMSTRVVKKGPWYIDDSESMFSCCQLNNVMTEFGCQGLELDFPIVCWGDDFIWKNERWFSDRVTRGAKDSYRLRKNSYRVLLSRGRDGLIIFMPKLSTLDGTAHFFESIGVKTL